MKRPPPRAHHEVVDHEAVDHDALLVQEWRPVDYTDLVAGQREYFHSGATRPVAWRRQQLEAMKALLADNRDRFFTTLHQDLRRNDVDSDLMDVGFCIKEAEYALKHMHHWVKAGHEPTPVLLEPGHVKVRRDPLGVTLIIGPWNEPLMLTFGPLAPALAAGNTAVIKPSEMCAATQPALDMQEKQWAMDTLNATSP